MEATRSVVDTFFLGGLACLFILLLVMTLVGAVWSILKEMTLVAAVWSNSKPSSSKGDQSQEGDQRRVSHFLLTVYKASGAPARQVDIDPVVRQMKQTAAEVQQQGEKFAVEAIKFIKTVYGGTK